MPNQSRTKTHLVFEGDQPYCRKEPFQEGAEFVECANEARIRIVDCSWCIRKYIEEEP